MHTCQGLITGLSAKAADTTSEQFLQLLSPRTARARLQRTLPGCGACYEATSRPRAGLNHETATHPHQCRPALHALLPGYLFSPRPWEETVFLLRAPNHLSRLPQRTRRLEPRAPPTHPQSAKHAGSWAGSCGSPYTGKRRKRVCSVEAGSCWGVVQCQHSLAHPTKARTRRSFAHRDPIAPGLPRRLLRPVRLRLWPRPETGWFSNK